MSGSTRTTRATIHPGIHRSRGRASLRWVIALGVLGLLGFAMGPIRASSDPVPEPAPKPVATDEGEIALPIVESVVVELGREGPPRVTWGSHAGGLEVLTLFRSVYGTAGGTSPYPIDLRCDGRTSYDRVGALFRRCEKERLPAVRLVVASPAGDEASLLIRTSEGDTSADAIAVSIAGRAAADRFRGSVRLGRTDGSQVVSWGRSERVGSERFFGVHVEEDLRRGLSHAGPGRSACVIQAEAELPYGAFVEVVEILARAGVRSIHVAPGGGIRAGDADVSADPSGLSDAGGRGPGRVASEPAPVADESSRAIDNALAWLAEHQHPDGHWDVDSFHENCDEGHECSGGGYPLYDVGITGLALLAFLGDGHTHDRGEHRQVVKGGLRWLRIQQDAEGCFGARVSQNFTYNHAIATLAMVEAYRRSKSPLFRRAAENGIGFIEACRNPHGAWRYGKRPGDADTSVTSWMATALARGKAAGIDVSEGAFQEARRFLKSVTDESGRVGYTTVGVGPVRPVGRENAYPSHLSESLTAAGVFVRLLLGEDLDDSRQLQDGARLCSAKQPVWERSHLDFYYWYYGSQAMERIGGEPAEHWSAALRDAVIPAQVSGTCSGGSWDPVDAWSSEGGRIYATTLLALSLQASGAK